MKRAIGSKNETQKQARKPIRVLLPSNRVAEFTAPKVGEYLQMEMDAVSKAGSDRSKIVFELADLMLKRCLTSMSVGPVQVSVKAGFNVEQARADAVAAGKDPDAAEDACEDVAKTLETARCLPVTDLDRDNGTEPGGYLESLPDAELGTVEASDWRALKSWIMTKAMTRFTCAPPEGVDGLSPKARRTRELRE